MDIDYWLQWYRWSKRYLRELGEKRISLQSLKEEPIHIFMNGPSLNDTVHYIYRNPGKIMMVNLALCHIQDMRISIKPDYYCFVDPAFGDMNHPAGIKLHDTLAKYGEILDIYTTKSILKSLKINNQNLIIHEIYSNKCPEYRGKGVCYLLKRNMASPDFQGVIVAALYVAIQLGYKKIYLYGADHNGMKKMKVNGENHITGGGGHFYEKENDSYKISMGEYNMKKEFEACFRLYNALYGIKKYADDLNISIVNLSPESWLDCFDKISL